LGYSHQVTWYGSTLLKFLLLQVTGDKADLNPTTGLILSLVVMFSPMCAVR